MILEVATIRIKYDSYMTISIYLVFLFKANRDSHAETHTYQAHDCTAFLNPPTKYGNSENRQ